MPVVLAGIDVSLISGQVIESSIFRNNIKSMAIFRGTSLMNITSAFYVTLLDYNHRKVADREVDESEFSMVNPISINV